MSGPPGPHWSSPPHGAAPGGESPAALDAALRTLREERERLVSGIGEQLYGMVMRGQLRDPAIIAAFRPLYDTEQQIFRIEAALRTYGSQPPQPAPAPPARDTPGGRLPWESGPPHAPAPSASRQPTRMCAHCHTPIRSQDAHCPVCGRSAVDALPLTPVPIAAADAPAERCARCGNLLRGQDRFCPVCGAARSS